MKLKNIVSFFLFFIFSLLFFNLNSASADITTGLVGHWKMDEASGTTVSDSVGTNNGTISGATWTAGKINNGLSFNGTTNYVSIPKMNYDEITISAWFYKNTNDTIAADAIWGGMGWNADTQLMEGFDLRFYLSAPDSLNLSLVSTNGTTRIFKNSYYNFGSNLSIGAWHHTVITYNKSDGNQRLYVDGVLRDTDLHSVGNTIVPLTKYTDMRIGYSRVNNGYWNGLLDDLRIYSRALSATDVAELYNYAGGGGGSSSSIAQSSSSSSVQSAPTATTNSATSITSTSATLNGTINNNGLTATIYFQYGLTSAFGNTTPTQTISSLGDISINSFVSNLSPSTVYNYRIVAQSSAGTTYGSTQIFTTANTIISSSSSSSSSVSTSPDWSSWKNWHAVAWRGNFNDNLKYVKQAGYDYVDVPSVPYPGSKTSDWVANSQVSGLNFYMVDPQTHVSKKLGYENNIYTTGTYTATQQEWFNKNMVHKGIGVTANWYDNLQTAWTRFDSLGNIRFAVVWDFQQQAVIDLVVEQVLMLAKSYENLSGTGSPFKFAGFIFDSSRLEGQFWRWDGSQNLIANLTYWTGSDSGYVYPGTTHEYATFTEGQTAFYKKLKKRMKEEFPNAKFIFEPWRIYNSGSSDEFVYQRKNRTDASELTADFLSEELAGTEFVDDANNFNSSLNITKDMVGSSQSNEVSESKNRLIAAKAGINGSWFNWFGRWGGDKNLPNFQSITSVYPRLKLIRLIPNWDNLNNIPLANRSWDGNVYQSNKNGQPQSYISSDVMYSRQWKNGKLFAVFNTLNGIIKLKQGETISSIYCTDGYFIETIDCANDFTITDTASGKQLTLKSTVSIPADSSNLSVTITPQIKGVGYIITTATGSTGDTAKPTGSLIVNNNAVTTNSINVTLNLSATDNVGVTGYYVSQSSTAPTASQTGWTAITSAKTYSANPMFTLSSGDGSKTVYVWYKDAAGNVSTAYSDSITLAKNDGWKNHYGISWRDTAINDCKYAKQAGYDYLALRIYNTPTQYQTYSECSGLKFFMDDPHHWAINSFGYSPNIDTTKSYTQSQMDFYNKNMAWKNADAFPNNFATGWWSGNGTIFAPVWDMQQQAVIDMLVDKEISLFRSYRDAGISFAGYIIDIAKFTGDFDYWDGTKNITTDLSHWMGTDSSFLHTGITHEYSTYSEGSIAYFKKLTSRMKQEFPDAKWILEPWKIYYQNSLGSSYVADDWLYKIKNRSDKNELTPDMMFQESSGVEFVDDSNNFNSGVNITKDMIGTSQQEKLGESDNRLHAAKAGINGAWYNWFGHFGVSPNFQSITSVYPRLKLIRLIPNWDNLNNIPLANRSWDGSVYQSNKNGQPQSYISSDVMYSRQWKNGKLFAVFNTTNGIVKLKQGETITSIQCVDGYFIETTDCSSNFTITDTSTGKQLKLNSNIVIPIDSTNNQVKGVGYIITTATGSTSSSSATTSSSSSVGISASSSSSQSSSFSSSSSVKFRSGDRVKTTTILNVRSSPSGTLLGTQPLSSLGYILSGPTISGNYNWYYVNYDSSPDGWSIDDYLINATINSSSSSTASGGGGGGGGGGGTTSSHSSVQSSSSSLSSLNSTSFVNLSSSSYRFTRELRYGFKGSDVTELQKRLTSEGLYSGLITGYYGGMTRDAVKKYQIRNKLSPVGAVGPMTLSTLNKSSYSQSTASSSSSGFTLRDLVEILINLGVIAPDKADMARTALQAMEGR